MTTFPNQRNHRAARAHEFLSVGVEELMERLAGRDKDESGIDFDTIIVGSGYGAAVAAATFSEYESTDAGEMPTMCILERGRERLPGRFPSAFDQLPGEVRYQTHDAISSAGECEGLFDLRVGKAIHAVIANGLGGGSLINAGVMLAPEPSVFTHERWPSALRSPDTLEPYLKQAALLVGADISDKEGQHGNTVARSKCEQKKYAALASLGGRRAKIKAVPITVKLSPDDPDQSVETEACIHCGDCATGCNHNAKKSLDTNLLAIAAINGVQIYCGATVLRFDRASNGLWHVFVSHTESTLRSRSSGPTRLTCRHLVLAAGTFGSTELMLRSQKKTVNGLTLSDRLGAGFSGNGDMIVAVSDRKLAPDSVASEGVAPNRRKIGPTISGMLDMRKSSVSVAVQELAIPAPLERVLSESIAFSRFTDSLTNYRSAFSANSDEFCRTGPTVTSRVTVLALMGDDGANGLIELVDGADGDGGVRIKWSDGGAPDPTYYQSGMKLIRQLVADNDPQARVHANPLRNPFGGLLQKMVGPGVNGPLLTVHPLGGCAMGDSPETGVVNEYGQVFDPSSGEERNAVLNGLTILDGSIVPGPLGINPALTISALALRASRHLAEFWGWRLHSSEQAYRKPIARPVFLRTDKEAIAQKVPTRTELVERLRGRVKLKGKDGVKNYVVELTLRSKPVDPARLARNQSESIPLLNQGVTDTTNRLPDGSRLRIYREEDWDSVHKASLVLHQRNSSLSSVEWARKRRKFDINPDLYLRQFLVFDAPISGQITVLNEVEKFWPLRLLRGSTSWLYNRGVRDLFQFVGSFFNEPSKRLRSKSTSSVGGQFASWMAAMPALFLHAGRVRQLSYHLVIGEPIDLRLPLAGVIGKGDQIRGIKTIGYSTRANPWHQLMSVKLEEFPAFVRSKSAILELDLAYLGKIRSPLFTTTDEQSQPEGYGDMFAFLAYATRVVLLQHFLSFRKPDEKTTRRFYPTFRINHRKDDNGGPSRLPDRLPSLTFHHEYIEIIDIKRDPRVTSHFRLTRYQSLKNKVGPPVLLIHGYSASGTMYAHPALYGGQGKSGGLARYLCDQGRDVWVLDLRTSCGLTTARDPWDFEDIAFHDIPLALRHIQRKTDGRKIDIVAHCMGAVMLSMTIIGSRGTVRGDLHIADMPDLVNRIVLSQAGPFLRFSPANILRGYLLSWLRHIVPIDQFQFNPGADESVAGAMIDRLLSTIPYPDGSEYRLENPLIGNRPWVRTRHRMDAFYGQTFNLHRLSERVKHRIDDFIGPMNSATIEQTILFARRNQISDRHGAGFGIMKSDIQDRWPFPTLWIHGSKNGLIDPVSPALTAMIFEESGKGSRFKTQVLEDYGHLDTLIGENCQLAFDAIERHLSG